MARKYAEIAMTPAVREAQQRYFGRSANVPAEADPDPLGPEEMAFIAERDSFYMATVSETGWPYLQHRGGRPGFLRVLDPHTLAFPDYKGNRQLLSTGNISVNDRVSLFLMDYPRRERLKILGHARVESVSPELVEKITEPGAHPPVERVFFIEVVSFDWNCSQYITPRYTATDVEGAIGTLKTRIAELEAELAALRGPCSDRSS
jgi:predicted pyridoxine 5'-phosphate oxidase superfamily flavin-nucleotide-binding protein